VGQQLGRRSLADTLTMSEFESRSIWPPHLCSLSLPEVPPAHGLVSCRSCYTGPSASLPGEGLTSTFLTSAQLCLL
jgi:hypothetical protein